MTLLDLYTAAQKGTPYDQRPGLVPMGEYTWRALSRATSCRGNAVIIGGEVHVLRVEQGGAWVLAIGDASVGGPIDPDLTLIKAT